MKSLHLSSNLISHRFYSPATKLTLALNCGHSSQTIVCHSSVVAIGPERCHCPIDVTNQPSTKCIHTCSTELVVTQAEPVSEALWISLSRKPLPLDVFLLMAVNPATSLAWTKRQDHDTIRFYRQEREMQINSGFPPARQIKERNNRAVQWRSIAT